MGHLERKWIAEKRKKNAAAAKLNREKSRKEQQEELCQKRHLLQQINAAAKSVRAVISDKSFMSDGRLVRVNRLGRKRLLYEVGHFYDLVINSRPKVWVFIDSDAGLHLTMKWVFESPQARFWQPSTDDSVDDLTSLLSCLKTARR